MRRPTYSLLVVLSVIAATAVCPWPSRVTAEESDLEGAALLKDCVPAEGVQFSYSPFGLHAAGDGEAQARDLNAHFVRKIVLWQEGEPRPGDFRIPAGDIDVRRIQAAGLDLVVTLRTTSQWGVDVDYDLLKKEKPSHPWTRFSGPPRDMSVWLAYVRRFVERFDGDGIDDMSGLARPIRHWQIGNEIRWQWQGTGPQYLDLLKQTAATIREADPQARIILGALTGGEELIQAERTGTISRHKRAVEAIEQVLTHGADSYDIVDFHAYDDEPYTSALLSCWLRERIEPSKAIWSLENAGPFEEFTTEKCSEDLVKRHVVALASGVEGFFWSSLNPTLGWSENYQRLALLTRTRLRTPAYHTYKLLSGKLSGLKSLRLLKTPDGIAAFEADTSRGTVLIAWSDEDERDWVIPLNTDVAQVTHILTEPHATLPRMERIERQSGDLTVRVSSPVFIERLAR